MKKNIGKSLALYPTPLVVVGTMLCEVVCYVKKVLVSPKTRAFFFL